MMSRKFKSLLAASAVLLAGGGYLIYSLMAAQAQGVLAQAPLNNLVQTPPAFIMAVDDSNSMTFERMFPGGDGRMRWNSANGSFFSSAGVFYSVGDACANNSTDCYLYLYPHANFNTSYSPGRAIPPLDIFGFARSPTYNASYYDPTETYQPWRNADGTLWANAPITAARADPRSGFTGYTTTYDLTSNRASTNESFQFVAGMTIPNLAGTGNRYYRDNAWRTDARNIPADVTYPVDYFPATFYLPASAAAPTGYRTDDVNRPVITGACGPGCNMRRYQIKSANYANAADYNAAIQNFANWFQYHRNRILAIVGSASHAMVDVNNMRVGYFTINKLNPVTMYDMATSKTDLYTQIYKLAPAGGTPNRQAVEYLGKQFRRTDPGAPVQMACQKNGGMLFTDGYTNTSSSVSGYGNADGVNATPFNGAPFKDAYSNTIADVAAAFYGGATWTPLRNDAGFPVGQVPINSQCKSLDVGSAAWKRLDCQPNLHMNFYGVTLGAQGKIYGVNQAATDDPYANPPNWDGNGDPLKVDDGTVIDEIWHAAINSRGEFINAQTPAEVTAAMRRVLSSISGGGSPSGSLGMTGARIGAGSLSVTPRYDIGNEGTDWYSRLKASKVSVNPKTQVAEYTEVWDAAARLTSSGRQIVMNKNGAAVDFSSTNVALADLCKAGPLVRCTEADLTALGATNATAVAYLRGDAAREVRNGGIFRDRTTLLGDIINSNTVVSSPLDDYGFRQLGGTLATSYGNYLATKVKEQNYMVYVGANDGMFHGFDGGMNGSSQDTGDGGRERLAYIPATSLGHMGNLLFPYKSTTNDQKFQHRYFVDGPVAVSDMYDGTKWRTAVVGTAGAGGRAVFALDVTDPTRFGTGNLLWEINDSDTRLSQDVRNNIGNVLGKPVIVPVRSGTSVAWKAIFGNGYGSVNGKAVLFVVDMATGSTSMIEAEEASSTVAGSNGLGALVVVDRWSGTTQGTRGRDGAADTVYAADQRGALWKFDLRSAAAKVTTPVFTTATHSEASGSTSATYRQPITGGLTAATGAGGGVMLFFGTGSFSFVNDPADVSQQALYGVNDVSSGAPATTLTPSNLQAYSVATSGDERTLAAAAPPVNARGWTIALPTTTGERFVGNPTIVGGVLFMPTYVPNRLTAGCSTTGSNWLFGLETLTGAGAMSEMRFGSPGGASPGKSTAAVSLKSDGTAPVKDVGVSAIPRLRSGAGAGPPGGNSCWMVVTVPGGDPMYAPYPCGRQSWRQVK